MFRIIVFTVALTIALADDKHKCHRLLSPHTFHCCKIDLPPPEISKDELAECFKIPPDPHSCETDLCIAKKRGFATDDGALDKKAFEKILEEDFKTSPTLVEAIKENCIKGDLSKVGPPDACDFVKMKMCIDKSIIFDCKDWDNTGPCTGMKDLVKECAKLEE